MQVWGEAVKFHPCLAYAPEMQVSNAEGIERGKLLLRLGDGITRWPSQANLQSLEGQELEVGRRTLLQRARAVLA